MVIESKLGVASRISNLLLSCIFYLWIIQQYPNVHLPFDPFVYSTIGGRSGHTKAMDKAFRSAQQVIRYNRYNPFTHLYSHVFLGLSGYSTSAVWFHPTDILPDMHHDMAGWTGSLPCFSCCSIRFVVTYIAEFSIWVWVKIRYPQIMDG